MERTLDNTLPITHQMQFMRPRQLEEELRRFPVVYVPIGLIEWHGLHLPLGTDALKAHGFLVKCAEQFGGVVYPPIYYPTCDYVADSDDLHPQEQMWKVTMLSGLFKKLRKMGARVIIAVTGHNVAQHIAWINRALEPVVADGQVAGIGLHEYSLSEGEESGSDHAAKWETSDMMFFHPDLVDISALGDGPLAPNMQPPDGIGGLDPRKHASYEVGRRNVELATAAIGAKARELLASLPEASRAFTHPGIRPPHWWHI